jgi:hypothetical protein
VKQGGYYHIVGFAATAANGGALRIPLALLFDAQTETPSSSTEDEGVSVLQA